jgi:hypothetical protein
MTAVLPGLAGRPQLADGDHRSGETTAPDWSLLVKTLPL